MKIGIFGDVHIRVKGPRSRTDDWFSTQLVKFICALDFFKSHGVEIIIQPGDFFDSPRPVYKAISTYMGELIRRDFMMLTVLGQHDVYYHDVSDPTRTATNVMHEANCAYILQPDKPVRSGNAQFYGASWGQEPCSVKRSGDNVYVLVAHAHVAAKAMWEGHAPTLPADYANQHTGYDLIVLGDCHYFFRTQVGDTLVVNMGSLMRMRNTPLDRKHEPTVGVYDTDTGGLFTHKLPIKPAEEVFVDREVEDVKPSVELDGFLTKLKDSGQIGTSFIDNLNTLMDSEQSSRELRSVVGQILQTVGVKDE